MRFLTQSLTGLYRYIDLNGSESCGLLKCLSDRVKYGLFSRVGRADAYRCDNFSFLLVLLAAAAAE
jgi:hypothetical protein